MLRFFGKGSETSESSEKTGNAWSRIVGGVFGRTSVDPEFWDELEEALIVADVGVATSMDLVERVRAIADDRRLGSPVEVEQVLRSEIASMLCSNDSTSDLLSKMPVAVMVVGVNGAGKTTSIGKLAYAAKGAGRTPLIAAADTFRAGAISQLQTWAERSGSLFISSSAGAEPGSVVFDAMDAAKSRGADFVVIDTAGRLQTSHNLMEELRKMRRILERTAGDFQPVVLLVIDGTTGQNGVSQAKIFTEAVGCDGVFLTKLDSTAKGGVILAIQGETDLPVLYIGTGESIEDIAPFDAQQFAESLLPR